jgi:EAL domain-containing protein (putative c-di-GMP-specific phosphodiesterase class I)
MAHSMGMKVVAEGVETRDQYDLIAKYAANEVQGNLLSKPVTPGEIEALMQDSITLVLAGENVLQMPRNTKAVAN